MFLSTECDSRHLNRIRKKQRSRHQPALSQGVVVAVGGMQLLNSLLSTGAQQRLQQRGQWGKAFKKSCWEMETFGRRCLCLALVTSAGFWRLGLCGKFLVLPSWEICHGPSKMSLVSSKWYHRPLKPTKNPKLTEMCIFP